MARKSLFTKNGLKSLFSQSEANLKDRLEKNDQSSRGKTFKFPKLKKKKKTDKGVVVEETDADRTRSVGGRDEELWLDVTVDQSASLYGTAPRSKRVLHASETDLRKPRKFGTFTFSWRKKKKGTDLPLQTSEVSLDCMGHEEQGVSEVDPAHWISSPLEEASGTTKVGVEPPELTHVLTNAPSIHTFPSQAQDSLTDPSPAEEPEKKSFLPLSQESFDDQVNIITLAASMTNKESLGESPGRPTAHPPKVDSEPSLPHTSPLQMEVPQYKAISEMKPVVLTSETVLPRTGFVKVESTKIDELVTGVTPEKTDSCALSPSESLHSATLNETRPCSGSPSSQITITQFLNDPVLSNTNHSVIEPSTQQGNDNLVSDVAAVNANINIPQSDITDVIINSPSSTAELATDIISPNTETLMPECEVIETTVDITAPDLDIITNAVTTNISISKEDSTDAVATSTPAEPAADMISPSPDTLVTTDTANPDSTDIRIPKADIMHISDDVSVTTSDTTVLPSADITVPNSTMSSPTAEIMADTSWINTPNTPTVNQNLTKLCTSGNDKLATDVAVQNTDIANLEADTTDEVAILNRSSKAEAPDMVFNAETHTLECESTENAANITAPNPDIVSDAIGSDINIPKADITFDEPLSANVKVPNPTVSSPSTETTAAITDINILNNSTLIDQSLSNPCTSSDDKLVSNVSIPNADITIPKADVTDALANSTSETAELATDMFFPNTEITMSECKIVETTVNIPAPDPDIISNADSTDITILQVNNTDVIATPISSALEPAAGMISFTTDTLLPECENTQTPAHISDLDPNAVSDVVGPDISISKASEDITFTSADVVATCDTIEYLSPDIVVYNPPMSTSSMENTAATTDINIPVISDESADIKADPDMITNAVSIDTTTHKADVTHEITNSTSSVLEPGTDMISTIDTLLPECEITDTVSDVISNDISISKADVTFTSADVAVDTCYTIEHRSGAIVVPSSPVSTLSKVNAATTDIHVSEISIVDQIAHNSVISDTSADITAGPVAVTTSPEGQTPLSSDIPFSTGDADSSSTDDITCTEADTSHTTANFVASSADTTDVHTDMASSVRHNNITCLDDIATLLPQESSDLSSANVISSSNTCVSGNDFETETCSSNLFQHHFCELDPDPEPVLPEPATHEPAALIHFPQVTDSSIPAPDLLGPDLTSTIASSTEECSDASVSATDGNMNSVESIATSFTNSSSPAMESLICDSNNLQGIKDSDSSLLQGPNTKITKMRELVPSDMYSLSALSISGSNPCVSMPSKSTTANISPLFSHMATTECFHSISATEIQEAMEKEQECAVRIEDHMDYEADSPKTRANAPTDLSGIVIEVSTNETKDGESVETTCKTLLGSVEPEKKIEPHLSFDKSSGVDEHLAMSSVLEEASGFVDIKCVQSTEAPLHLEDFLQEHKGSSSDTCHADNTKVVKRALVDVATTDTAKQSKTELASVTDMMAAVEHFVSSPQKSHSVREKSYATNPPMNDERAGVDGDRHGVIADIPQCLNLELNTVHSEPSDLEAPRVALQSFDKKQHRQTEDAFIHVTDKGVVVRPEESTAIRHVEVSESIVLVQVQQRGVDQKEIPKEMSDGNCSMDREGYGQQEALFQTVGKVKQEKVEVGMSVHGSIIPSLEPATPVSQVCKPAECDPAQELGKERVLGVILNSFCLAKFPDRGAEPLPQALGEITKNECHNSMGAESTNNLPETQPQLIQANAGQMPLGNTQLLDTKTQTQLMEEEAHMPQAVSETPFTYADTIHSTQTLGQGSHARLTLSQPHGSTNSHTVTTESTSVVLIRAETETEAAVPCKVEPDGLTVNTTNLTDTGRQKLHRPVIIVQRAAGPSEPQTSADTTDFSLSTMEVSRATFTFSSLSTPETKDLSPVHVASNTYTFSSSSTPESKDGKQCHKVSIAGIPETSERTIRSVQPISPTLLSDEELSDRMKARYLAYQYKPNPGVRAFPFTETLDNHNQGVSSALSYSSFYSSSSAVPEAVPLEPARYTPHRFSSERREQPDTQPTSPTPASPSSSSPSNQRSWLSDRAEVQPSEPGGRSWVGLAQTPAGESSTEGGRETESVSERQGERGLYSGSDTRVLLNHSSSSSHSSVSINSSGSSWGPASPTVQLDGYSGVFKATRVELTPSSPTSSFSSPPTTSPISTSPLSPQEPVSPHLETLKDTLKTMEKPARPRSSRLTGAPSLPPIKEDTLDSPAKEPSLTSSTLYTPSTISASRHTESLLNSSAVNGNVQVSLPANLGLNWNTTKDMRSPLTLMKLQQQQIGLNLPPRASTVNSIVMRSSSFGEDDAAQLNQLNQLNGNAGLMSPSRLDNSLIFSSGYQPQQQQVFQPMENGLHVQRTLFRTGSLPETGSMTHERISSAQPLGLGANTNHNLQANLNASRIERLSFLASPASSITLDSYSDRMSMPPTQQLNPLSDMNIGLGQVGQTNPLDALHHRSLQRTYSTDSALGSTVGTPLFNDISNGRSQQTSQPEPEPAKHMPPKYRAFPDAYLTKEKEHGKLNPRPGKMIIYDQPGMKGERIEVRGDVVDATGWDFPDSISLRIIRGGWVLYEKPSFKGEKIALDEGDIETLSNPFDTTEEAHEQNGQTQNGEANKEPKTKKFVIGSIRRAVRDYSVPEISLFPEENAEGKKVVFRDTSEDARIFGFPIKANSIIINAGLWLVYAEPFFQGIPRVLEVGGFTNPAAWGVTQPYVSSLHPLKIGEPRVEKPNEPKLIIYDKPYFTGKSRELYTSMRDFMTRVDRQQKAFMYNAGSLKVIGGIWVGYEKEGFRGKQYLLEEGEYQDWRVWGGCDAELRSVRVIRADLTDPALVMYEFPDEQGEEPQDERTFEVTEAIPDVELFGFHTNTRSIHVLSGAWVAYSHVDFSGNQFILEKGFYNNFADWGAGDNRICSLQPILMAPSDEPGYRNEVMLYSDTDFQGNCKLVKKSEESLPESFIAKSCRVVGSSWVLYEGRSFAGNLYTVCEGDYPNLNSMGCPTHCIIRSIKPVPVMFAVPSISLFGLENFEGREITVDMEVLNLLEAGFNNHVLSVRVNSGCWVVCEHSNYRGRQFLLEPIEVTSWQKFSELTTIGSMYPIREKRRYFRVKNKERGHYLSIQGGVEDMKTGRVVVMPEVEGMSDIWYYQDGLLKNKLSPTTSLQVMGNVEPGAKVVLWNETRMPIQIWSVNLNGTIVSTTFPGMVLDIKGGKAYDRDHVVIREESEEHPCQHWELELM